MDVGPKGSEPALHLLKVSLNCWPQVMFFVDTRALPWLDIIAFCKCRAFSAPIKINFNTLFVTFLAPLERNKPQSRLLFGCFSPRFGTFTTPDPEMVCLLIFHLFHISIQPLSTPAVLQDLWGESQTNVFDSVNNLCCLGIRYFLQITPPERLCHQISV